MTRHVLVLLPDTPIAGDLACPWLEVVENVVTASGEGSGWLSRSARGGSDPVSLIGLVGPGRVRVERVDPTALADPQARTVARLEAQDGALGVDAHAAVGHEEAHGWIATTSAGAMRGWLDFCQSHGAELDRIVPLATLMPVDGKWHEARFGRHTLIARDGLAIADEPDLVAALVGDAFVDTLDEHHREEALLRAIPTPPVDLRQGAFARKRSWAPDPKRLREFAILVGLILILAIAIPIAKAVRWDSEAERLDRETAAIATAALARPVTALEAETALRQSAKNDTGGAGTQALTSLLAEMQAEAGIEASMISFDGTGALTARLGASDIEAVNRLLLGLQRRGWTITAKPLSQSAGRAAVDLTMMGSGA